MRLVFIIGGAVATTGMLIISMWLNYLFGSGLGQTPMRAVVFGCVSIIVAAWKGLGPIYILSLVRARRIPSAGAAIAVWFVCFLYLADRVEPAEASARIDADQMYRDYVQWCAKGSRAAMSATDFVGAFDRSRVAQGIWQIKKVGRSYYGIRLVRALV